MEPVEVDGFHGRWSESPPVQDEIRVVAAPSSRTQDLIALTLARLPHLTRAEVASPFESPELFEGLVVEEAIDRHDHLLGWGLLGRPSFAPAGRLFIRVLVAAEHEGRGVGRALRSSLTPQMLPSTTRLSSSVFDDDPRSYDVARHWGFELEAHAIDSALDLTVLPVPDPPDGVTLHDVPDLDFDDRDAVDTMLLASQTNPEAQVGWVFDLDKFALMVGPKGAPICVLARVDGRPAGISFGSVIDGDLRIAYSGVDPAWRGRGLMMLIKQQAHLSGRAAGARRSRTNNEEHNTGIRRVNAELGYVVTSGVYRIGQPVDRA